MKIFISYGCKEDQIKALRIQTLAAVYGIECFVPPAWSRQDNHDGYKTHEYSFMLAIANEKTSRQYLNEITNFPARRALVVKMGQINGTCDNPQLRALAYLAHSLYLLQHANEAETV